MLGASGSGKSTLVQLIIGLLQDNLNYFPEYRAAFFARNDLPQNVVSILSVLSGRIDNERMRELNRAALRKDTSIAEVASSLLVNEGLVSEATAGPSFLPQLWRNTQRHLKLTFTALVLAIGTGVGVAILVHRHKTSTNAFLYLAGLMQTVPSIALLALLIPFVGVGQKPAIIALFLYSLLPIARNTVTAMQTIPSAYRQVAAAMGMTRRQELRHVLMPLAMPHVLAGIATAAIIRIGTATLAAFIGAGGLGRPHRDRARAQRQLAHSSRGDTCSLPRHSRRDNVQRTRAVARRAAYAAVGARLRPARSPSRRRRYQAATGSCGVHRQQDCPAGPLPRAVRDQG